MADENANAAAGRTLTFFALGGSGIRSVEPLLHLCALGLGPRQLRLVLIDPDQSNAAIKQTRALVDLYQQTRNLLGAGGSLPGFFRTEVVDAVAGIPVWSPIADDDDLPDARFATRVDRALMRGRDAPLGHLFDLLYADKIRDMDLGMGFRGIPSIGTVFMNRLREQAFFGQLLASAQSDADSLFFAVGSIFGGTGSAAFPVVARALGDGVRGRDGAADVPGVPRHRVGGALLLPYFTLPAPPSPDAADGGPRPQAVLFAQNAAAAIPTYTGTAGGAGYGSFYVLGDDYPREQDANEVGGERQANRPHYVELFAALAALDFAARGGEDPSTRLPVFHATALAGRDAGWDDLPLEPAERKRLMGGIVAAHTFLTLFRPGGSSNPSLLDTLRGVTWMRMLNLAEPEMLRRSGALDRMGEFFRHTWHWLGDLKASVPAMQLARVDGRSPQAVGSGEVIEGYRNTKNGASQKDVFHVFRFWNVAAHRRRGEGFTGFLEVMREGSEAYAGEAFAERTNVREDS
jgi:hypothetical protein